jgi:lipopolysaccharide transport system permease protein
MFGYLQQIWKCRYLWLSLAFIDLRARYRRSILGIGWSLVRPLVFTLVLCVVFQKLFRRHDVWSYAPYLLAGLCCWDYLVTATKQGCQCFFQAEAYIRQCPTPIAIFPLRTALVETIHFLVALVVLVGLSWYVRGFSNLPVLISLIPSLVLFFGIAWALAILAGFANVYFQDTQHLCDVGFQLLFYATPIVYYPGDLGDGMIAYLFCHCNPINPFMHLIREPIVYGNFPTLANYGKAFAVLFVFGSLAGFLCSRLQRRLIFQL